jgi:hypothetical protein
MFDKTLPEIGLRAAITEKIASYGSAITVGVFIGTALTTGMAAGIAGWYLTNKLAIASQISSLTSSLTQTITGINNTESRQEQKQVIDELQERVAALERNFRLLNAVDVGTVSKTEVEL